MNKENPQRNQTNKRSVAIIIKGIVVIAFILIIVLVILFFMFNGRTTTSGEHPENTKNESLVCETQDLIYPKTDAASSDEKELKISMVFYGTEKFASASLKYTLHFSSRLESAQAESRLHAQLAQNLASSGLQFSEFNNKFSIIDETLMLTLFTQSGEFNEQNKDFFLVQPTSTGNLPISLEEFRANYESQGFTCNTTI